MLKDPLNTLKDTCEEFIKRYGKNEHGLFVYGDATSKKQDTKLQKGQNFYLLIKGYLSKLKPIFKVPKANPRGARPAPIIIIGTVEITLLLNAYFPNK